ncbi:MAG: ribosome biogenesis GTPase Der [Phototrophicales bacterium]|nr:ribosome biogenesis GTPase Der [Phototrophicales bacterium]
MSKKPVIALVGRPNVGKSTLFNRLIGERLAVIDDIPGTTRDRIISESFWGGISFHVVDTGGIEIYQPKGTRDIRPLAEGSIDFVPQIKAQAMIAIEEADVIIMLVDAVHGVTAADEEIALILRRTNKPVLVAANKADTLAKTDATLEFYSLGVGEVFAISAIHGLGTGDLLDAVVKALHDIEFDFTEDDDDRLKIAIVGRPNAGKSTLINHLLGEERVIVSPIAGTTRDSIDTKLNWHGEEITIIDTAGIRKRGSIEPGVEKFSVIRAFNAIERCDVAVLMIDSEEGITEQDEHIAGYVLDEYKSLVIVFNKWDALEKDSNTINEFRDKVKERMHFIPYAPVIFISALTGQRIHEVLEVANRVYEARHFRLQTAEVNRVLRDAIQKHPAPLKGTKRLKIYFGTQVSTAPPIFLLHVNDKSLVHFSYRRYLENQFRQAFPFEGTPIRISFRQREGLDD